MQNTSTPTKVRRWSFAVFLATTPTAVGIPLLWALQVLPGDRPYLVLMVFMLLLEISLGAALTCLAAHLQLTVQRAFLAGMRVQQQSTSWPRDPRAPVALRAVADEPPNYGHSGAQN